MRDDQTENGNGHSQVPAETRGVRQTVAAKAKELAFAALEMEQLALLDETPFEEALLLAEPEMRKRYTAEHAAANLMRRNACIYMLGRSCPIEDIARILRMNHRIVAALAAQNGRAVAGFSEAYAEELIASAAADIALADTKKHAANYKDLYIGAGIKLTHAQSLKVMSGGADLEGHAIDVQEVDEDVKRFREGMKKLKTPEVAQEAAEITAA